MLGKWLLLFVLAHVAGFSGVVNSAEFRSGFIITGAPPLENPELREVWADIATVPTGAVLFAVAVQTWEQNPTVAGIRALDRWRRNNSADVTKMLTAEEANKKFTLPGMKPFTSPVPEPVAESIFEANRERINREYIIERRAKGWATSAAARFAVAMMVSLLDPIYMAAVLIPTVLVVRSPSGRRGCAALGRSLFAAGNAGVTLWRGLVIVVRGFIGLGRRLAALWRELAATPK